LRKFKDHLRILTVSDSSGTRPIIWQNADKGAVKKKVNWLPLCTFTSAGFLKVGLKGERNIAAVSPLSAPCNSCNHLLQIHNKSRLVDIKKHQ
jgi:hypothetical protein